MCLDDPNCASLYRGVAASPSEGMCIRSHLKHGNGTSALTTVPSLEYFEVSACIPCAPCDCCSTGATVGGVASVSAVCTAAEMTLFPNATWPDRGQGIGILDLSRNGLPDLRPMVGQNLAALQVRLPVRCCTRI